MAIAALCVYCGSSPGRRPEYLDAARTFGRLLARRSITLIYGGGRVGMMGALADAALAAGGRVTGVIPRALVERELAHPGLTELVETESMHARKTAMAERADAFVALPGGIGTLEELFEVWTWTQLGFQSKPCGLLNVAGYFDALVTFADQMVSEGYLGATQRRVLRVESDPAALLTGLEEFVPEPMAPALPASAT
jgi:uncharacterized protein (TIGR00730 family)